MEIANGLKNTFKKDLKLKKKEFHGNAVFESKSIPILHREINSDFIYQYMKNYDPDVMLVFGSSIIKESLISLGGKQFINLHLGLAA